jgi:hypothetical protein
LVAVQFLLHAVSVVVLVVTGSLGLVVMVGCCVLFLKKTSLECEP